jgi:hypothetical protein
MKKLLLILSGLFFFFSDGYSQASFNSGTMEVAINQYGRIRLFDGTGLTQLERASILVGTSVNEVFDYTNDAEQLDSTLLVASPLKSDFEIYGAYDNSYSGAPPDVVVKLNAYGWNNQSYTIARFNVKNDALSAINAFIGLDIIPEINEEYGYDSVTYNAAAGVIRFHRGNQENMGIKQLSGSLSSLASFEWYDGYTYDSIYWPWMNYGSLQAQYISNTADGPVTITSQAGVSINPGGSTEVFYALALGADESSMLANMQAAVDKYNLLFTSVGELTPAGNGLVLGKNYPNPCRESTRIAYAIPSQGFVSMKLYDAFGKETATFVNERQDKGEYSIELNTQNLTAGIYNYTLTFNNQVQSRKMVIIK